VALIFGFFILVINFVVDMLLAVINPQSTIIDQ
jgi:ABC-type dipeptide/oligopeptide/nickel transport system permease component